jgi:hypothetical protein
MKKMITILMASLLLIICNKSDAQEILNVSAGSQVGTNTQAIMPQAFVHYFPVDKWSVSAGLSLFTHDFAIVNGDKSIENDVNIFHLRVGREFIISDKFRVSPYLGGGYYAHKADPTDPYKAITFDPGLNIYYNISQSFRAYVGIEFWDLTNVVRYEKIEEQTLNANFTGQDALDGQQGGSRFFASYALYNNGQIKVDVDETPVHDDIKFGFGITYSLLRRKKL